MNGWLYIREHSITALIQLLGLGAACFYLRALKLSWPQIFPLFFTCLAVFLLYHAVHYLRRKTYFRRLALLIQNLDEKYLFTQVWKASDGYEDAAYYCLLKECTRSMLEQVETSRRNSREYREWLETYVHDMKQPISSIRLISERSKTPDSRAVLLELENMNHLLEQVLYYGRNESRSSDLLIRRVNILAILNQCLSMNKQLLIQNHVRLHLPDSSPDVYGDEKALLFLLNQIVYNAVTYLDKPEPELSFRYLVHGDFLHFYIRDNGCGIADEDLPRLFEKGFTGKNGRKNRHSTGMGLYLCKKTADRMGIRIRVDAAENIYTEVCLILPLQIPGGSASILS